MLSIDWEFASKMVVCKSHCNKKKKKKLELSRFKALLHPSPPKTCGSDGFTHVSKKCSQKCAKGGYVCRFQ